MVSYHPAKFGGHSHSSSEAINSLFCHVILQDHEINGSRKFMGWSPHAKSLLCQVWWP